MSAPAFVTGADALWPLHVAIVARMAAYGPLVAALAKIGAAGTQPAIYSGRGAPGASARPLPHVATGLTTGAPFLMFDARGSDATVQLDVYAAGPGYDFALPIVGHVCRALDGVRLALPAPAGGWNVSGFAGFADGVTCDAVATMDDPTGAVHGVVRWSGSLIAEPIP